MPVYTFNCARCEPYLLVAGSSPPKRSEARARFPFTRGMAVSAYERSRKVGFGDIPCPRCKVKRAGQLIRDSVGDMRSQVTKRLYTFDENAPDELVGRTVSEDQKRKLFKEHGLMEAGNESKRDKLEAHGGRRYRIDDIKDRWEKADADAAEASQSEADRKSELDSSAPADATLAREQAVPMQMKRTWPNLLRQAKDLGVMPETRTRETVERAVRAELLRRNSPALGATP